jgi:hypothetical protein
MRNGPVSEVAGDVEDESVIAVAGYPLPSFAVIPKTAKQAHDPSLPFRSRDENRFDMTAFADCGRSTLTPVIGGAYLRASNNS